VRSTRPGKAKQVDGSDFKVLTQVGHHLTKHWTSASKAVNKYHSRQAWSNPLHINLVNVVLRVSPIQMHISDLHSAHINSS
jgi:hypothetical protein